MQNKEVNIKRLNKEFGAMLGNLYKPNLPYVRINSVNALISDTEETETYCYQFIGHYGTTIEANNVNLFDIKFSFIIPAVNYNEEFIKGVFYQMIIGNESARFNKMKGILEEIDDDELENNDDNDPSIVC